MWINVWILLLIGSVSAESVNNFCQQLSQCRRSSQERLEKCMGGVVQVILGPYEGSKESRKCQNEVSKNVESALIKEYNLVDDSIEKCISKVPSLDETQEKICTATAAVANLTTVIANSTTECRSVFDADIRRCELLNDCCPQYQRCRVQTESDSGIAVREKMIILQYNKCLNPRPAAGQGVTSVPRISNGTLMDSGVFIIHSPRSRFSPKPKIESVENEEKSKEESKPVNEEKLQKEEKKKEEKLQKEEPKKEEQKKEAKRNPLRLAVQSRLGSVLCNQLWECENILSEEENRCYLKSTIPTEQILMEDFGLRSLFLNNSKTESSEIRLKCLNTIDVESQKKLLQLQSTVRSQLRECVIDSTSDVEISQYLGCHNVGLVTELSALRHTDDFSTTELCLLNLNRFRSKCRALRRCCPQRLSCERENPTAEQEQLIALRQQLLEKQTLCEN